MSSARSVRVTSLERALHFSLAAWRDSWFVLSLSVIGPAVMFFGEHGPVSRDLGMALMAGGGLWSAAMFAPLTAGLYRSALNRYGNPEGRRYRHGVGGLRLGAGEVRMLGLAILMFLLAVLFLAPASMIAAALAFVFRSQGELSVLGALRYGAYCGLGVLALYPVVALRVALGGVASVAEDRIQLFQTWPMTHNRLLAVAAPLAAILLLYPVALWAAALANLQDLGTVTLGGGRWPLVDAAIGTVLSGLFHGALMPTLFAGVLTHLYLAWRPDVVAVARRKPVLRVVADLVETGHMPADERDAAMAANDRDDAADPADEGAVAARTRRSVAAYQIGTDRIDWPDHRSVAFDTSGQAFGEPATIVPTPAPAGVWPEIEVMAQRYAQRYEPASTMAGPAAHPPVFDGEGHEHARSPIDPAVTALEHPMLLAPDADWAVPDHSVRAGDDAKPQQIADLATGTATVEPDPDPAIARTLVPALAPTSVDHSAEAVVTGDGRTDGEDLADMFWLSGVVPPDMMAVSAPETVFQPPPAPGSVSGPVPVAEDTAAPVSAAPYTAPAAVLPLAANAEDVAEAADLSRVMAMAPTLQDAPPPVQVIAFLPPRPFHRTGSDLTPAVAANDAAPPPRPIETLTPALPPARDAIGTAEGQEG